MSSLKFTPKDFYLYRDNPLMVSIVVEETKQNSDIKLCECGCGQKVKNRFIFNHHNKGKNHNWWKGGIIIDKNGYILIYSPNHPFRNKRNQVRKHRLVMEEHLTKLNGIKTYINLNLHVHHKDRNPNNNEISNLEILTSGQHTTLHNLNRVYKKRGGKS